MSDKEIKPAAPEEDIDKLSTNSTLDPEVSDIRTSIQMAASSPSPNEKNDKKPNPLIEALARGEIPEEIRETWRLVDPESPEGKIFHESCLKLAKELYNPAPPPNKRTKTILTHHDFDQEPVRFLLSKDPTPNAWYAKKSAPPIFVFTTGLFTKQKFRLDDDTPVTESCVCSNIELKMLIGHEMTHAKLEGLFHDHPNSKVEESVADLVPLKLLADNGQNPEPALWLHKKLNQIQRPHRNNDEYWREIFDEHPIFNTRYGMIENGLTALRKERGNLSELGKQQPFDDTDPLQTSVRDAKHTSYLTNSLPTNYETQSPPEQLKTLYRIFTNTTGFAVRYQDINEELNKVAKKLSPGEEKDVIDDFANFIIEKIPQEGLKKYAIIYGTLSRMEKRGSHKLKPLGRLRTISDAATTFIEKVESKSDAEQIKEAAKAFVDSMSREALFESENGKDLIKTILWPSFKLPNLMFFSEKGRVGWENLRELVATDKSCLLAALALGLGEDFMIFREICADFELALPTFEIKTSNNTNRSKTVRVLSLNGRNEKEQSLENYYIDENGLARLIGYGIHKDLGLMVKTNSRMDAYTRQSISRLIIHYLNVAKTDPDEAKRAQALEQIEIAKNIYRDRRNFRLMENIKEPLAIELADDDLATFLETNREIMTRYNLLANIVYGQCDIHCSKKGNKDVIRKFFGIQDDGSVEESKNMVRHHSIFDIVGNDSKAEAKPKQENLITEDFHLYYVLKNHQKVFSGEDVLKLCEGQIDNYLAENMATRENRSTKWAKSFLELMTPHCLEAKISVLKNDPTWDEIIDFLSTNIGNQQFPHMTKAMALCHAMTLFSTKSPTILQITKLFENLDHYSDAFKNRIKEVVNSNIGKLKNYSLPVAIKAWKTLQKKDLFGTAQAEKSLSAILEKIASQPAAERIKYAQSLLEDERIIDAPLREKAINMLIGDILATCGEDDQSKQYADKIKPYIEWTNKKVSRMDQPIILNRLGKSLISQRDLTLHMEQNLPDVKNDDVKKSVLGGILTEFSILEINKNPKVQKALTEFLVTPLTNTSIDKLFNMIKKYSSVEIFFGAEDINKALGKPLSENIKKESKEKLKALHENFWLAPFEARALILKELIGGQKDLNAALDQVMSLMFEKDDKYQEETATFIKSYIYSLPDYTRFVALAAMLAASEKRLESKGTLGESIAMFAEKMGPAETKVAQVAEGHPGVPEDISEGLRRLKFSADEPPRWEIMHWIDDISEELLASYKGNLKISRVGRILGSASIFIAVEIFLSDGTNHVIALKRPHALERGRSGFETLNDCMDELGEDHSAVSTMHELIVSAQKRLEYETSCELAPLQYSTAKKIYADKQITFKNTTFSFDTPPVTASGKSFFMMGKVTGKHFSQLPTDTDENKEHKKRCAQAIVTQELINIFNGSFDSDRHGGNILIEGNNIHHIDFKGMMLEKPSEKGYEQLSRLLFKIIPIIMAGGQDILNSILKGEKELKDEEGAIDPYVSEVTKAIISLGEYLKELADTDLNEILQKVLSSATNSPLAKAMNKPRNTQ